MEYTVNSTAIGSQSTPCVILGIYESRRLSPAGQQLNKSSGGYLASILKRGDIQGKLEQSLLLHDVPGTACERVLLVGCGSEKDLDDSNYRKILSCAATTLDQHGIKAACCYLLELSIPERDLRWKTRQAVEVFEHRLYRFNQLQSKPDKRAGRLRKLSFNIRAAGERKTVRQAVKEGQAVAIGTRLARDLANLPGNICTPTYLAAQARKLARQSEHIKLKVLGEREMARLNMGALLSVARGSRQEAKLIVLDYQGGKRQDRPYVLVGKGITFDSGGISIKPSAAMDEMKFDMCGAASTLGTLAAVAEMGLPLNVIGVIPSSENLPDGNASKPGDIVTSMSGQTIEVLNTDAEGRLVLCDALSYCERFKPRTVIDIATLTGACVIALGKQFSGLLGNNEALVADLIAAGKHSGDVAWQLPLGKEYQQQLKSNFADMANVGGREAGTITAACFLSRFTDQYHWAHLDIAGTAWHSGHHKGATGRPVPLLTQYLIERCRKR